MSTLAYLPASRHAAVDATARLPGVPLATVLERAELQVRLDRKHLVPAGDFERFVARLEDQLEVLEIDGRRSFDYESRYFDTPDLLTYRDHVAGRPDRFKLRTRSYLDSGETMFEVKLEDPDGGTIKRRTAQPFGDRDRITPAAQRHLARALDTAGRRVPRELGQASVIAYRRTTFVIRDGSARITVDREIEWSDDDHAVGGLDDHVLVEVKSAEAATPVDRALEALGISPVSISKYGVGMALLHPELPSGPWDAVLERYFDRPRELVAA